MRRRNPYAPHIFSERVELAISAVSLVVIFYLTFWIGAPLLHEHLAATGGSL